MAEKSRQAILEKFGIEALNEMQETAHQAIDSHSEVILLSPTGTGKTLAFLLPIVASLDPTIEDVQVLILVPSRELAIQIEQVTREMGSGFKTNAVYGGRSSGKDKLELKHAPAILIGTPGRVADHLRRRTVSTKHIKTLVLDEFDKSLEVGFETEMNEILDALPSLKKKILTSATQNVGIPEFVGIRKPKHLNFLTNASPQLQIRTVVSKNKDKLEGLVRLLKYLKNKSGIVFCNFKDTIQFVSDHLSDEGVGHVCFYGGLEQIERERALIKFRNGTHRVLLATDLAARGIDVPNLDFIIHYQLPPAESEFTHRNGRTARMNADGTAYILKWENDELYDFVKGAEEVVIEESSEKVKDAWETLFISGGRKDKISKGDIAGLFFKQGELSKEELGVIELKQDCAFVSVPKSKARKLVEKLNNTRLKKKKVRITIAQ
ncbi:MAG: DEAD/DEAH box helicase [Cyclobacteriaceae bacterium]